MTKKDYEWIAGVILYNRNQSGLPVDNESKEDAAMLAGYCVALNDVAFMLADSMQWDNPRFDRSRFLKACGIED